MRYAQVLQFEQGGVRLLIPTVISPRYGDPVRDGGLQPHQIPGLDLLAAYPFDIRLRLHGELAQARVASPSLPIAVGREDTTGGALLCITLARQSTLDLDFVLVIGRCQFLQQSIAVVGRDPVLDQCVVLVSVCPCLPTQTKTKTSVLKILVDCSGP